MNTIRIKTDNLDIGSHHVTIKAKRFLIITGEVIVPKDLVILEKGSFSIKIIEGLKSFWVGQDSIALPKVTAGKYEVYIKSPTTKENESSDLIDVATSFLKFQEVLTLN